MNVRIYKGTSTLMLYQGKYEHGRGKLLPYCILLSAYMFTIGCSGLHFCGPEESWLGDDKQKHFLVSAAMGAGITAAASSGMDTEEAVAAGILSTTGVGVIKEWHDSEVKKTCFSWKDLVWNFIGASMGATMAAAATD